MPYLIDDDDDASPANSEVILMSTFFDFVGLVNLLFSAAIAVVGVAVAVVVVVDATSAMDAAT